jgi:hypothetical protein
MLFYKQILDVRVFPLIMMLQGLKHVAVGYFNINNSKNLLFISEEGNGKPLLNSKSCLENPP